MGVASPTPAGITYGDLRASFHTILRERGVRGMYAGALWRLSRQIGAVRQAHIIGSQCVQTPRHGDPIAAGGNTHCATHSDSDVPHLRHSVRLTEGKRGSEREREREREGERERRHLSAWLLGRRA
jgi:hypothetical protein